MKILVLEDNEERITQFKRNLAGNLLVIVDNADEAIDLLMHTKWDVVMLDHDLGGKEMVSSGPGTGYQVAVFLEQNPEFRPPNIIVHSMNPVGAKNILAAIDGARYCMGAWTKNIEWILKS